MYGACSTNGRTDLPFAPRYVIGARVTQYILECLSFRHVLGSFPNDNGQLHFPVWLGFDLGQVCTSSKRYVSGRKAAALSS